MPLDFDPETRAVATSENTLGFPFEGIVLRARDRRTGETVHCGISDLTLVDHFAAHGTTVPELMLAFDDHRIQIESLWSEKHDRHGCSPEGVVLLEAYELNLTGDAKDLEI